MYSKTIKNEGLVLGKIYPYSNLQKNSITLDKILSDITRRTPRLKSNAYAGFLKKVDLKENLRWNIGNDQDSFTKAKNVNQKFKTHEKEIADIIEAALIAAKAALPSKSTKIYIFPTFSNFIKEKWAVFLAILHTKIRCIFLFILIFLRAGKKT